MKRTSRAPHPRAFLRLLLALAVLPAARADDWPQWRGPRGDGRSLESAWRAEGRPAWRATIGAGYSSPSVGAGRVVVQGYFADEETPGSGEDRVSCLDAATGEVLWTSAYAATAYDNEHAGGALSTPTISTGTVFVATRSGEVRAFALEDGTERWRVDLVERHGVAPGRYGFASSPFVMGDAIVLNAGRTVALERATGETRWISEGHDANYSTVAPIRLGETDGLVVFGGEGVAVLDAGDGRRLALHPFRNGPRNVEAATPIVLGERVFVSSAYDHGAALIDFGGEEPAEVWRCRRMRNKMAGCVLHEGFFYGYDESILKCIDSDGQERWRKRGLGQGAVSVAGDRLLFLTSDGELVVALATPEAYAEEARIPVLDEGFFWTAPVLAEGRVFCRGSLGDLVCVDHRPTDVSIVATLTPEEIGVQPLAPEALVARHLAAIGLAEREAPSSLRLTGKLDVVALGLDDVDAVWEIRGPGQWHVRMGLPPAIGGFIDRYFDGEHAWELNPYRGNERIEDHRLDELRDSEGNRSIFRPVPPGARATDGGFETFAGLACQRLDVEVTRGVRNLYFEHETGLLVGRTGEDESTVILADWREVDGIRVPFARTVFDLETGIEERFRFTAASLAPIPADGFELPEDLRRDGD